MFKRRKTAFALQNSTFWAERISCRHLQDLIKGFPPSYLNFSDFCVSFTLPAHPALQALGIYFRYYNTSPSLILLQKLRELLVLSVMPEVSLHLFFRVRSRAWGLGHHWFSSLQTCLCYIYPLSHSETVNWADQLLQLSREQAGLGLPI